LKLADDKGFKSAFLMDALVLCRLDKSLTENQAKSLAEFVNLLSIDEVMLTDVVHLSNKVLSYQENTNNGVGEALEDNTSLTIDFDYNLLKHWHDFTYRVVSVEALKAGIDGNSWLVVDTLEINCDCHIKNAYFAFIQNGSIKATGNSFVLSNCIVYGANLELRQNKALFEGNDLLRFNAQIHSNDEILFKENNLIDFSCNVTYTNNIYFNDSKLFNATLQIASQKQAVFVNSTFENDSYQKNNVCLLFNNRSDFIKFDNCNFFTPNRIALMFKGETPFLEIFDCHFENCGNDYSDNFNSAIVFTELSEFLIKNTIFKNNLSKKGKDIYIAVTGYKGKKSIEKCQFIQSIKPTSSWEEFGKNENSIYFSKVNDSRDLKFKDNIFINSGICIMHLDRWIPQEIFSNCIFKYSPIYTKTQISAEAFCNCNFENSSNPNIIKD